MLRNFLTTFYRRFLSYKRIDNSSRLHKSNPKAAKMVVIDIVRNAELLEKCMTRLEKMGEAKPKTVSKLKHAIQPISDKPLVSIAEPFSVLHELQKVYGDVKVNLQYTQTNKLDVARMAKSFCVNLKNKVKHSNGLLVPPPDEGPGEMISNLKTWIQSTLDDKKSSFTAEEFEKQFMVQYMEEIKKIDVTEGIINNLRLTGFISTTREEATDTEKVTYNFPSDFTLACMRWILKKYEKQPDSSDRKRVKTSIRSINRHLMKLSKALSGEIDSQMKKDLEDNQIDSGVDVLNKSKRRSRRQRWESCSRSSSRSPSRSPHRRYSSPSFSRSRSRSSSRSTSSSMEDAEDGRVAKGEEHGIMSKLIGGVQGLALGTAAFLQNSLASLCQGLQRLEVSDVRLIPHDLTLEAIHALLVIGRMGESRPRTVKALRNAIKPACRFHYLLNIPELFSSESHNHEHGAAHSRKRRRQRRMSRRGAEPIIVGREVKVAPVSVNISALFLPGREKLMKKRPEPRKRGLPLQSRDTTEKPKTSQKLMEMYLSESAELSELVKKQSVKQAQHWFSCVTLGDQLQVSAAAGDIYRWLCHDTDNFTDSLDKSMESEDKTTESDDKTTTGGNKTMECDTTVPTPLRTFRKKAQLLQVLAERCVTCKTRATPDQLIQRLEADGFLHISPDGVGVVYPTETTAASTYKSARENLQDILNNGVQNYLSIAEAEMEALVKEVEARDAEKEKKNAVKLTSGRGRGRGKRMRYAGPPLPGAIGYRGSFRPPPPFLPYPGPTAPMPHLPYPGPTAPVPSLPNPGHK